VRSQVSGVRCQVSGIGRERAKVSGSYPTPDTRHLTPRSDGTQHVGEFLRNSRSRLGETRLRAGVTLIELLVTILIISILAALVLGVAAVAAETARQAQSRHIVERLHTLLTEHYDTYKTRRVKLRPDDSTAKGVETQINTQFSDNVRRGQALAEARLYAMRELMLMEVPDRWSDVLLADVGVDSGPPSNVSRAPLYLAGRTDLSNVYLRRYLSLVGRTNTITGQPNTAADVKNNQGAECLYMIVMLACGDGEARTLFAEHNIGDSDGDGAPEFLDGWGHPVNFLRWAPGFDSQIQLNANPLGNPKPSNKTWTDAAAKDHDPFDVFRVDQFAFRLVPLIYSPGRDESSGLAAHPDVVTWRNSTVQTLSFNSSAPFIAGPVLTAYQKVGTSPTAYMGTAVDETATDDVHNHLMGQR
jgi:prepilin-type N-terminal cleavage/methylation domain-containing protein